MAVDIAQLLAFAVKNNASDLHLSAGVPPMIRVDGDMKRINMPPLTHKEVHSMVYDIMNDKQRKAYEEFFETDFSFEIPKLARFRVNAFNQNRGAGAVFRNIPSMILVARRPERPEDLQGHVRCSRAAWCWSPARPARGKSTTLAAMIDYINDNRPDHIITIEDPIEFVHESQALPDQPARGARATRSASARRCARPCARTPTSILVGEMRDLETIRLALDGRRDRPPGVRHPAHQLGAPRPSTASSTCSRPAEKEQVRVDAVRVAARGHLADAAASGSAAGASRRTRS